MTLRLDRLQASNFNARGMQTLWQRHCEALEAANLDQATINAELASQLAQILAAQATANTAVANAATAQTTANTANTTANAANTLASNVNKNDKNTASATVPTSVLTATDAGANVTIGVIGHDRQYGDGTSVTLTAVASAVTALSYSTLYAVYYDDTGYTGGAKTYHATTTLKTAQPEKVNGRHYCGQITTPAATAPPVTGGGAYSPSGSGPYP